MKYIIKRGVRVYPPPTHTHYPSYAGYIQSKMMQTRLRIWPPIVVPPCENPKVRVSEKLD